MIADSWSANRWNFPFGAGRSRTRGLVRASGVFSRGARASTEARAAVSSVSVRVRSAWTATFGPAAAVGFADGAQNAFVPYGSRTGTAPRDEFPAETAVADSARTAARPTSLVT